MQGVMLSVQIYVYIGIFTCMYNIYTIQHKHYTLIPIFFILVRTSFSIFFDFYFFLTYLTYLLIYALHQPVEPVHG